MSLRTIILAKAPVPGLAKTRLVPALGEAGAAQLAERMLAATLQAAIDAEIGPVELCTEPPPNAREWRGVPLPAGIELTAQVEGDLGARLDSAARGALTSGNAVVLIGTDCVEMSADLLRAVARELREVGTVMYGTADGGYALLGLTRFDARIFADIPWSSSGVAAATLRRFGEMGWPVHLGPALHDVDVPEDLVRVPARWLAQETRRFVERARS